MGGLLPSPWSGRPALLAMNGGYVDTAGFLALQGLFTAHVTGNFVTLGAALVFGHSGVIAKLIALPVFCLVVAAVRLAGHQLSARNRAPLRVLLWAKIALLTLGFGLALRLGPFHDGDAWPALLTGMVLVSAMAVQNGVQRIHLPTAPPGTLMTGNTTQLVIDVVDLLRGTPEAAATRARLRRLAASVASFAIGCAAAALLFWLGSMWCFAPPPLIALAALLAGEAAPNG